MTNTDGRAAWNILFAQLFWLVVADSELFILLRNRCLLIGAIFLFLFLVILQLKFLFISASRDWTNNNNSAVISSRFSKKKKPFASHRPSLSARNVVVCTRLLCLCVRFCLCLLLARSNCRHRRCCCWGFSFPRTSKQLVVVVVVVVGPFCLQTTHVAWAEERSGAQTARFFFLSNVCPHWRRDPVYFYLLKQKFGFFSIWFSHAFSFSCPRLSCGEG